jgi:hypothetical protein
VSTSLPESDGENNFSYQDDDDDDDDDDDTDDT